MLQATYNNNTYTFLVTLQDVTSTKLSSSFSFLFKFTNDISGDVKWAYGQNATFSFRYCKFDIYSTAAGTVAESVFGGVVNFEPNGYWKYEIYLTDGDFSPCGNPNPNEVGTWDCTNVAGTSIDSGDMNVDVYEITTLPNDTYTIDEYSTCDPPPTGSPSGYQLSQVIDIKYGLRRLLFTRVVRNINTNTYFINAFGSIGYDIKIYNANRTYVHNITTNPEVVEINIECDTASYTVELWDGGVLQETYNDITPLASNVYPESQSILASNNYHGEDPVADGSIFFGWRAQDNVVGSDYVQGPPLEIGKLLVSEQVGEEQVQYNQHESPKDTNYIYNE
tara:strand:- start:1004 stop:2011 length:1008 start_codon:yes stop_codon:yes gene_type:complete